MQHNMKRTMEEAFGKLAQIPKMRGTAKILLLTHSDLDGEGAAMILSTYYNVEVRRLSNGNMSYEIGRVFIENQSADYDFIIATDISCSEKVCRIIAKHPDAGKFIILDHHQTSDYLNDYPFGLCQSVIITDAPTTQELRTYFKDKTDEEFTAMELHSSGTTLMYDYLKYHDILTHDSPLDKLQRIFAHCVRCYDTWDWHIYMNDPEICHNLDILYDTYGAENFARKIARNLHHVISRPASDLDNIFGYDADDLLMDDDLFIIQCEKDKASDFVESIQKCVRTGNLMIRDNSQDMKYYSVAYVNCNKYLQETFDMMKTRYPETDIYIIYYGNGLSFRAVREDINIGQIVAEMWNGGGHPGAAGVKVPGELIEKLICDEVLTGNLILDEKERN